MEPIKKRETQGVEIETPKDQIADVGGQREPKP